MSQFCALQSFKRLFEVILTLHDFRQQLCGRARGRSPIPTDSCTRQSRPAVRPGLGGCGVGVKPVWGKAGSNFLPVP